MEINNSFFKAYKTAKQVSSVTYIAILMQQAWKDNIICVGGSTIVIPTVLSLLIESKTLFYIYN